MTGRIIVADDHPLFREGMLSILQRLLPEARIEEAGDLAGSCAWLVKASSPIR